MPNPEDAMNPLDPEQTDCQRQIAPVMEEWQAALDEAASLTPDAPADVRERVEAELCLTSRSAYFGFYTWVVLNDAIDADAERDLETRFARSLDVMTHHTFRASVDERYTDFRRKCEQVRRGQLSSQLASSFDL